MNLTRRELLGLMATASAATVSGCSFLPTPPRAPTLLSGVYDATNKKNPRPHLLVQDLNGNVLHLLPIAGTAHSVVRRPQSTSQFLFFPQAESTAGLLYLGQGKPELREFIATPGWMFYGHGAYTLDGTGFYSVETRNYRGKIVLRDLKKFAPLREWLLPGYGAHDCQLSHDGKTLFVAMDGLHSTKKNQYDIDESSLLQLNLENGVISRRASSPRGLALGHFAMTASGLVAGAMTIKGNNQSSIAMANAEADFRELPASEGEPGREEQTLSVAIHTESGVIAGVCPQSNEARFWQSKSGEYLGQLQLNHPVGLSAIGDGFAITSRDGVTLVNSRSLTPTTRPTNLNGFSYLAHHLTCNLVS